MTAPALLFLVVIARSDSDEAIQSPALDYGLLRSARNDEVGLSPQRPLRVHIQRIDRLARGHEQAVALQPAETQIGAAFGQRDAADHDAVGREYHDAVEFGIAHAPSAPEIAVDVAAKAIRRAGPGVDE